MSDKFQAKVAVARKYHTLPEPIEEWHLGLIALNLRDAFRLMDEYKDGDPIKPLPPRSQTIREGEAKVIESEEGGHLKIVIKSTAAGSLLAWGSDGETDWLQEQAKEGWVLVSVLYFLEPKSYKYYFRRGRARLY